MHDFCYVSKREAAPIKAELIDLIYRVQDYVRDDLICTPKVRQTFGGVYFYERKEKKKQKILARIQNICYNGYARTSFELR